MSEKLKYMARSMFFTYSNHTRIRFRLHTRYFYLQYGTPTMVKGYHSIGPGTPSVLMWEDTVPAEDSLHASLFAVCLDCGLVAGTNEKQDFVRVPNDWPIRKLRKFPSSSPARTPCCLLSVQS